MCGLVLAMGKPSLATSDIQIFKNMLAFDQLRGDHSTGCFGLFRPYNKDPFYKVNKQAMEGMDFARSPYFINTVCDVTTGPGGIKSTEWAKAMFGHNRWATQGAVNAKNAHPFTHDHITLVHNGTLRNQSLLPDSHKFEVDSENICYSIAKIGVDETIQKLNGAFALIWFDASDMTIHIIRNTEREFHLFETNGGDWFGCSEEKMGDWLLTRGKTPKVIKRHFELTPGIEYVFDVSSTCVLKEERKHELPTFRYTYPAQTQTRKAWEDEDDQYDQWFQGRESSTNKGAGKHSSRTGTGSRAESLAKEASKSGSARVDELLAKYNISVNIGSKVQFEAYSFENYVKDGVKQNSGQVIGWGDQAREYMEFQLHGISEEVFEVNSKCFGYITAIYERNECLHFVVNPNPEGLYKPYPEGEFTIITADDELDLRDAQGKYHSYEAWQAFLKDDCISCGRKFSFAERGEVEIYAGFPCCADEDGCDERARARKDAERKASTEKKAGTTANGKTFTRAEWREGEHGVCVTCSQQYTYEEAYKVRTIGDYSVCVDDKGCAEREHEVEDQDDEWLAERQRRHAEGKDDDTNFLDDIHDGHGDVPTDILATTSGERFSEKEWRHSRHNSCSECGDPIPFDEVPEAIIVNDYAFCGQCKESLSGKAKPAETAKKDPAGMTFLGQNFTKEQWDEFKPCPSCGIFHTHYAAINAEVMNGYTHCNERRIKDGLCSGDKRYTPYTPNHKPKPETQCNGCNSHVANNKGQVIEGKLFCDDCAKILLREDVPANGVDKKYCSACKKEHGPDVLYGTLTFETFQELDARCYWRSLYRKKFKGDLASVGSRQVVQKMTQGTATDTTKKGNPDWCHICGREHSVYMRTGNMSLRQWNELQPSCPTKIKFRDKFAPAPAVRRPVVQKKEEVSQPLPPAKNGEFTPVRKVLSLTDSKKPGTVTATCTGCKGEFLFTSLTGGMCKTCLAVFPEKAKDKDYNSKAHKALVDEQIGKPAPVVIKNPDDLAWFEYNRCPDCGWVHTAKHVRGMMSLGYYVEQFPEYQCRLSGYWIDKKKPGVNPPLTKRLPTSTPMVVTPALWEKMNTCRCCGDKIPYDDIEGVTFQGDAPLCIDCKLDAETIRGM